MWSSGSRFKGIDESILSWGLYLSLMVLNWAQDGVRLVVTLVVKKVVGMVFKLVIGLVLE
jgi:hypothetical protein